MSFAHISCLQTTSNWSVETHILPIIHLESGMTTRHTCVQFADIWTSCTIIKTPYGICTKSIDLLHISHNAPWLEANIQVLWLSYQLCRLWICMKLVTGSKWPQSRCIVGYVHTKSIHMIIILMHLFMLSNCTHIHIIIYNCDGFNTSLYNDLVGIIIVITWAHLSLVSHSLPHNS